MEALLKGESGQMVGLSCAGLQFTDLQKVLAGGRRPIDGLLLQLGKTLGI